MRIEDISVAKAYRRRKIGKALVERAKGWAKEKGFCGLSLECQDNNLLASRFCNNLGFYIGGVNSSLYRHMGKPYDSETAVFWYLDF